ncbi:MAG: helix-turn-helix domain-containing protein [Acidimicrobiales bacterium]
MESYLGIEGCDGECPVKKTAELIEGRWTTLVIRELLPGKKRFSEIQRALEGISPKVLTARLRLLERRQVLTRTVFATVPPTTEYELTPLGRSLEAVLLAMAEFGEQLPDREPVVKSA